MYRLYTVGTVAFADRNSPPRRFLRELSLLKRMADYSSVDTTNVNEILQSLGTDFSQYTYRMLQSGVDIESLKMLNDEQLSHECGIDNSIHRLRIGQAIRGEHRPRATASLLDEMKDRAI